MVNSKNYVQNPLNPRKLFLAIRKLFLATRKLFWVRAFKHTFCILYAFFFASFMHKFQPFNLNSIKQFLNRNRLSFCNCSRTLAKAVLYWKVYSLQWVKANAVVLGLLFLKFFLFFSVLLFLRWRYWDRMIYLG